MNKDANDDQWQIEINGKSLYGICAPCTKQLVKVHFMNGFSNKEKNFMSVRKKPTDKLEEFTPSSPQGNWKKSADAGCC